MTTTSHPRVLAGNLLLFYIALVVYVSLSPFSGWETPVESAVAFLWKPWPRYVTRFDVAINAAAYVPLGLLCFAFLAQYVSRGWAAVMSVALGAALSFAMETSQAFLPERIASNLDLVANASGCAAGVLLSLWLSRYTRLDAVLINARHKWFLSGAGVEIGMALLVVWLFSQLNPSVPFLGAGTVHEEAQVIFTDYGEPSEAPFALGTALNLCGVGMLVGTLARERLTGLAITQALVALAFCLKVLAAEILLKPAVIAEWRSHDTLIGLAAGSLLLLGLSAVPARWRTHVAAIVILAGAIMTKLAGHYGSTTEVLRLFAWSHGQLLNFAGLTLYLNEIWPILTLLFLIALLIRQRHAAPASAVADRV
jgi:VanZ family protein